MDITACILKMYPGWRGAVWGNTYDGIRPHELEAPRRIRDYEDQAVCARAKKQ